MSTFKWVEFQQRIAPQRMVTKIWEVQTKAEPPKVLGIVAWYSGWRKYAFMPEAMTVFEQDCLRDIAEFCERETREHKQRAASAV